MRDRGPCHEKRAGEVDVDDPGPVRKVVVGHLSSGTSDSRITHQDNRAAQGSDRIVHSLAVGMVVGYVAGAGGHVWILRAQLLHGVGVNITRRDPVTLGEEGLNDSQADAGRTGGHEDAAALVVTQSRMTSPEFRAECGACTPVTLT